MLLVMDGGTSHPGGGTSGALLRIDPATGLQSIVVPATSFGFPVSVAVEKNGDILVAGSGQLVQTLMQHDLVDEYRLMVHPVVLGKGKTMFDGVPQPLRLKLASSRAFKNGNVVLTYQRG